MSSNGYALKTARSQFQGHIVTVTVCPISAPCVPHASAMGRCGCSLWQSPGKTLNFYSVPMLCFPDLACTLVDQSVKGLLHIQYKNPHWDYVPASNAGSWAEGWQKWVQSFYVGYMGALCFEPTEEMCALDSTLGRTYKLMLKSINNWVGSDYCLLGQVCCVCVALTLLRSASLHRTSAHSYILSCPINGSPDDSSNRQHPP